MHGQHGKVCMNEEIEDTCSGTTMKNGCKHVKVWKNGIKNFLMGYKNTDYIKILARLIKIDIEIGGVVSRGLTSFKKKMCNFI